MYASSDLRSYRKSRRKFALKTYILLCVWFSLALIQWTVFCLLKELRWIFQDLNYISFATFALSVSAFMMFIFVEKLRFTMCLNFFMAFLIVELQIVSLFTLITRSWWAEMLSFFFLCVLLIGLFLVIGAILPKKMDLTLDIAVLFIFAFIFLIVAVFFLMFLLIIWRTLPYSFLIVELSITITILVFVMYHAQTIHGNRFAEMRLNDFILGSLILFHDFLIIYWLTFYNQIHYRPITTDKYIASSLIVPISEISVRPFNLNVHNDDDHFYDKAYKTYQYRHDNKDHSNKDYTDQSWEYQDRENDKSRKKGSGSARGRGDYTAWHRNRENRSEQLEGVTVQPTHRGRYMNSNNKGGGNINMDLGRDSKRSSIECGHAGKNWGRVERLSNVSGGGHYPKA
ncbi:uncharacterized protein LOC117591249 isoform X1 [Drosophila guanche]|uniref:Protein lifeguard 1 n=1 Tax=Drosophila guanche TaxID=7266 RepID=A0A3B0KSM2_DROGU|nr:uncharacterized protein LOC117591249 isoform X1 [Drosophila guanche]SPP89729.1 Hypothetical predicted protein [Drosophila guanche]